MNRLIFIETAIFIHSSRAHGGRVARAACCNPSREASHAKAWRQGRYNRAGTFTWFPVSGPTTRSPVEDLLPSGTLFGSSEPPEPKVRFEKGSGLSCWFPSAKSGCLCKLTR